VNICTVPFTADRSSVSKVGPRPWEPHPAASGLVELLGFFRGNWFRVEPRPLREDPGGPLRNPTFEEMSLLSRERLYKWS